MNSPSSSNPYKRHRFPAEIISHCVWLYFRFCRSYRDVEELMAERGVILTYEAVRYWCRKFGQAYAHELRRRRPRPGDTWHLDDGFLTINGACHYLWRAVDQDGHLLDSLVQRRRDQKAAKRFFRKLLKGLTYVPRVIITDRLKSYGAALREILPGVEQRQHRYLNNPAENSHQPPRQRERHRQGFKSPGQAQRVLAAYDPIAQHFRPRRPLFSAPEYRHAMRQRFPTWQDMTGLAPAASASRQTRLSTCIPGHSLEAHYLDNAPAIHPESSGEIIPQITSDENLRQNPVTTLRLFPCLRRAAWLP